ncbi:MAG: trehalose-phosphatase [Nocardioidaceae bacterium]
MEFVKPEARQRYDDLVRVAHDVVVGLDFDGTLSPIVADPDAALIHPDGPAALVELASQVRAVAIITGRPARQVVELGRLGEVADGLPAGALLEVLGQYGNERWDSRSRDFTTAEVPPGLAALREELPALLAAEGAEGAFVEEKGLAVAVHTRQLADPEEAFNRLEGVLDDAADRHGLSLEPGRMVLEVRAPGMHKGLAVRTIVSEVDGRGLLFVGDDLGDLPAFEAARDLRDQGLPALLVCSGSDEEEALVEVSDLVVPGPDGVLDLLRRFTADIAAPR